MDLSSDSSLLLLTKAPMLPQLAICIRGVDCDFNVIEELLSIQSMKDTTTGSNIFEEVRKAFDQFDLKWEQLNGIVKTVHQP